MAAAAVASHGSRRCCLTPPLLFPLPSPHTLRLPPSLLPPSRRPGPGPARPNVAAAQSQLDRRVRVEPPMEVITPPMVCAAAERAGVPHTGGSGGFVQLFSPGQRRRQLARRESKSHGCEAGGAGRVSARARCIAGARGFARANSLGTGPSEQGAARHAASAGASRMVAGTRFRFISSFDNIFKATEHFGPEIRSSGFSYPLERIFFGPLGVKVKSN